MDVDVADPTVALKALAEPVRWRILEALAIEELCVCHLVEDLDLPQPLVSHHLRALRAAGLVDTERFKQWTYYRVRTDAVAAVAEQLRDLAAPTTERRPCC